MRTSLKFVGIALAVSMLLSGCKEEAPVEPPAPAVGVMNIQAGDVPYTMTFHAQAEGSKSVEVRAQVSGILVSRDYEEGKRIESGAALFQIEPDRYRAAYQQSVGSLKQAQSRLHQAKLEWERYSKLFETRAVSQRDRDNALSNYEVQKANVYTARAACAEAKINLDHAVVKAPISGFAGKARHSIGTLVNANSSTDSLLTVITRIDPIYVNFSIPSPDFLRLRTLWDQKRLEMTDSHATLQLSDGSSPMGTGKMNFMDATANPNTSVVSARAEFVNDEFYLLPGQFARLTTHGMVLKNAILIPQQAMLQTQAGTVVTVVDKEGKAQVRKIKLNGLTIGEWFLLDEGLQSGDVLVVDGVNRAQPGQPVKVDEKLSEAVTKRYKLPSDSKK